MSVSIGIVGLPNVGKSTLFNALTKTSQATASNFPFTTIDPNIGRIPVPDARLDIIAKIEKSASIVPTSIEFVDIAGLVQGAHKGEGLGNQFLANIREADCIAQVIRGFEDSNIIHVAGKVNPLSDAEVINIELQLADLSTVDKRLQRSQKATKTGDKEALEGVSVLEKMKSHLESGQSVRTLTFTEKIAPKLLKELSLLTSKPLFYVLNLSEDQIADSTKLAEELSQKLQAEVIPIVAKIEAELADLSTEDQIAYMKEIGLTTTGLEQIVKTGYRLLDLITFLTSGPQESRAWTVWRGAKAPQAAGVIHTDFEKGFIKAEVVSYSDFVDNNGWTGARAVGKSRLEGKEYIIQDGDVCLFKFNV
jgi:hypothetical protein